MRYIMYHIKLIMHNTTQANSIILCQDTRLYPARDCFTHIHSYPLSHTFQYGCKYGGMSYGLGKEGTKLINVNETPMVTRSLARHMSF